MILTVAFLGLVPGLFLLALAHRSRQRRVGARARNQWLRPLFRIIPRAARQAPSPASDLSEACIQPAPMVYGVALDDSTNMSPRRAPVKVFIADDSELIRARVAAMLADEAMDVIGQAMTPQASIDGILAIQPDVVVLDVQLDGGSGLQVLRAVRQAAPEIAFVVFSNHCAAAYRKRYLNAGARRFLDKSTDFHQLARAVSSAAQQTAQ